VLKKKKRKWIKPIEDAKLLELWVVALVLCTHLAEKWKASIYNSGNRYYIMVA
jgi:hypothetical protein